MTARSPMVEKVEAAGDEVARARLVLTLPDSVLLSDGPALVEALRADRAGHWYVTARLAALHAVRSPEGELPPRSVFELGIARRALRKVARDGGR
ncbi:MAG: hypothetical protein J0H53_05380 [Rhizobiales bacterium]|nr:hypothetical protein [Hyphomicrobiales bacterium]OJU37161.1 MAG: hypothetical protein BGN94_08210 [Rhizobiales bacterium 68-8]